MLARLFQRQSSGFYIDIGAWHPTLHSVTKHFYELGWSGVNVEPIQRQYQLFVQDRPRDKNMNVAVGNVSGRMRFYECNDLTSLSTANREQAKVLQLSGHEVISYEVDVITLNDIIASCGGGTIDFLKVDVEGFEEQVLRGTDWRRFRPKVLLIEATQPAVQITDWDNVDAIRNWDAWEPMLLQSGYIFAWYDGLSRFYIREEDEHLKGRLALPPCVHDEPQTPVVAELAALSEDFKIQSQKLEAKNEVIRTLAVRDLERKALLGGSIDFLCDLRRKFMPHKHCDFLLPQQSGAHLHIAVDILGIDFGVSGGVETYMKMLTSALLDSKKRVTLICRPDQLPALQKQFHNRVGYFVVRENQVIALSIKVANRLLGKTSRLRAARYMATFARLAQDIGADLLHSPVQTFSFFDFLLPSVLNLHDLQHLHFPENFNPSDIEVRNYLYGRSSALADAIIVSSDFVRNDLITQMHVPPSKVFTVPVTWDPMIVNGLESFTVEHAKAHYQLPPTYALYPAQFWPHKNHARLVQALRIVREKMPATDLKLVLTGYRGHAGWPEVDETIKRLGLDSDVVCLDHVPVEHLAGLYKGAVYCVMPSTFEASSYPVIEAQMLGVPAMCSNVTSLPELMRDEAGLLFDPFDVEDIAAKMMRWLEDPEDRRDHAGRAFMKARNEHSLAKYVDGIGQVYEYVLKSRKRHTR
jgi:FkbM family methyltransferase